MRYAAARIVLADRPPAAATVASPITTEPHPDPRRAYRDGQLFHGPELFGIEEIEGWSEQGIRARVRGAPPPSDWMDDPIRSAWLADPLALDCAFQLMILWCEKFHRGPCLPARFGSYRQFRRRFPEEGTRVVCRITGTTEHAATAEIDFLRLAGGVVGRITDCECVIETHLADAFSRNCLPDAPAGTPVTVPAA